MSQYDHQDIVAHYRVVGAELRAQLAGVAEDVTRRQPAEGEWSMRQILGHLDRYHLALNRWIDGITTQDRPSLPALTEDLPTDTSSYNELTAASIVESIEQNARLGADKLAKLSEDAWQRTCVRTNGVETELEGLVGRIVEHTRDHYPSLRDLATRG